MKFINSYHTSFGAASFANDKQTGNQLFVSYDLAQQAESIMSAYNDIKNIHETKHHNKKDVFTIEKKDKNILYSVQKDRSIWIREKDKVTNRILRSVYYKDRKVAKTDTSYNIPENITFCNDKNEIQESEKYLREIFDDIDSALLNLRKSVAMPVLISRTEKILSSALSSNMYLPSLKPENKSSQNKTSKAKKTKAEPKLEVLAKVSPELVKTVVESYNEATDTLKTFKHAPLRTKIRNSYPILKQNERGSKAYEFKGIGPMGEDMSVNLLSYRNEKLLLLKVNTVDGSDKYIVFNKNGEVVKNHLNRNLHNRKAAKYSNQPQYITQKYYDIDFSKYLVIIHRELKGFNKYLNDRIQNIDEKKERLSTTNEGSIIKFQPALESVYKNYTTYKKDITSIKETQPRLMIKKKFGFESKAGMPALILKNITPFNEHLFISFPVIKNIKCTKIIVLDENDKVKKTLFIEGDRMVKFEAKDIHKSKRSDNGYYYHTQEEIDKSGLGDYLKMIDNRLKDALEAIKQERQKNQRES